MDYDRFRDAILLAVEAQQTRADWYAELAASVNTVGVVGVGQIVVDAFDGRIVAISPTVRALLGDPAPEHMDDLVARGTVARPDLERLRQEAGRWHADRGLADLDPSEEVAHSWTEQIRIHQPSGDSRLYDLAALHHRRPKFPAEVVMVTLAPAADRTGPSPLAATLSGTWWTVFDHELRVVATDQSFNPFGVEPGEQLAGVLATVLVHPEDIPEVLPIVLDLVRDNIRVAEYTIRMLTADGGWILTRVEIRRLDTGDGPMFVANQRSVNEQRRVLPSATLTARELEVVAALFDGYRVAQLADRDGVSVSTVRTQLASIYRKLQVGGQADVLARFHRPA